MPVMRLKPALRDSIAQLLIDDIDAGAAPSTLKFYTGVMPSALGAVTSQTLLGTLTFAAPCATKLNGVITFNALAQDDAADNGGVATWARALDGDGNAVADYDVGDEASTAAIKMNTTTIVAGGPILMTSLVITVGA